MARVLLVVMIAAGWVLASPGPAAAECAFLDPWPTFRSVVRAADRVIVGTVLEDRDPNSSGWLGRFGLQVDEVLRGSDRTGEVIEIAYLKSGLPLTKCTNTHLRAKLGQVVALALGARTPDGTLVNSVAWIRGHPDAMQENLGTISRAELRALAALPQTDTREDPSAVTGGASGATPSTLLLLGAGVLAALAAYRHTGRRGRRA